jgi:hypothetical protein
MSSSTPVFAYPGPKDVGRAESLYRSALTKPDLDYAAQLLFSSLLANPEHAQAFQAVLDKIPAFAAKGRKMIVRVSELLSGAPADAFLRAFAAFCASPGGDSALAAAVEAKKAGLAPYAIILGDRSLVLMQSSPATSKPGSLARLIDLFESCRDMEAAVGAAQYASKQFPGEMQFREREKNLLANKYLQENDLAQDSDYRANVRNRPQQENLHRPADPGVRVDELEGRYRQTHALEDFRDLLRALRDVSAPRREAALETLEDGLNRFAEKETLWFIREIRLDRRWSELRVHQQLIDENPKDTSLRQQHESMKAEILTEQIDHLYEVVGSLPPSPDRQKRELELAGKLLDAGRFQESIKQAQAAKRRSENRLDAWVVMAKSFIQLGLTPEASECFRAILSELDSNPSGSVEKVLEAKYTYAEFLIEEAGRKSDAELARQARKLCSDVMVEDIDYRDIRRLCVAADAAEKKAK